jgi:hypothetical protein
MDEKFMCEIVGDFKAEKFRAVKRPNFYFIFLIRSIKSLLKNSLHGNQRRLEACSTCSKHTGAEGAATVNKAPNAIGNGAKRQMNTVKFWLEPALMEIP